MAKFEKHVRGEFSNIVQKLDDEIVNSSLSMRLVDESNYENGEVRIAVRVYDKYFMRNGNRASLSLTIAGNGNSIFISAIGAGGGSGVIFNFSLGAETEMVEFVENCISNMGI